MFCSITGVSPDMAAKYLQKYSWDIHQASNAYLNKKQDSTPKFHLSSSKALVAIFDQYKDAENASIILIDGTLSYLSDLKIDPDDTRSLTLAYLLKSPQTGEISCTSFIDFWSLNRISSVSAMRAFIDDSHSHMMNSPQAYEKFYQYCFDFIRGSDSRIKSITPEDAVSYWRLLFGECRDLDPSGERLAQWYAFVDATKKPISKDTWNMLYKFLTEVIQKDPAYLSGYDEMSSWPSMVDEYLEWLYENGHLEKTLE